MSAEAYGTALSVADPGIDAWLRGSVQSLSDVPTVLVFWESWCPYSQAFVPPLETFASRPAGEPDSSA